MRTLCSADLALAPAAKVLLQHIALAHRDWLPSGAMPMGHVNEAQAVLHALIGKRPCYMLHLVAQLSGLLAIPESKVRRPWAAVGHWLGKLLQRCSTARMRSTRQRTLAKLPEGHVRSCLYLSVRRPIK